MHGDDTLRRLVRSPVLPFSAMLLTVTTTREPATDLGYLLHKNPAKVQTFELPFGNAHVFYPEATDARCTAALLLDVDPVGLVRGRQGPAGDGFSLGQYVSDRPYAASSFLSVAIARVFGSALAGRSRGRQELADAPMPLTARIAALPCRGGERFLRSLFEPLGYAVTATSHVLDDHFPAWGDSPYFTVEVTGHCRLSELLTHLYVLIPVLDDDKHYWVGEDEVEKLLRHGEGWLATHPEREAIALRYLKHRRSLMRQTLARLVEEDQADPDEQAEVHAEEEDAIETRISLNEERLGAVVAALKASGAKRVLDLGCGEGKLLSALLADRQFEEIVGLDVSSRTLERASERLHLDQLSQRQRDRIRLIQGSLTYRDRRLQGFDAAAVVEVVEHLDPPRLDAFARVLFEAARPGTVALTTPNAEYNVRFSGLPAGRLRHKDHRFEWTRAEFEKWSGDVAARFGYDVRFVAVGASDAEVGSPTQMAVFTRGGYNGEILRSPGIGLAQNDGVTGSALGTQGDGS
jgi:3' terminal RNA ribose 2'-O-methyltransferase Hen1